MNNSFVEISSVFIKDTNSLVHIYKHEKTDFRVLYFENNDEEYFFSFCFPTLPDNNKGIAHIVEHTVLSSSKRYQSEDPFKELDGVSVNTFMNAMTFSDATLYPASSKLFEDFKQIFEVYADAVFCPLLKKASFEKEGVKRTILKNGEAKANGIVLSEMLSSSFDKDTELFRCIRNTLFQGTPYEFDSGGEGEEIALLTYDEFIEFYKRNYSPSVCTLILSGKKEILEMLDIMHDRYLSSFSASDTTNSAVYYKDINYQDLDFVKAPKDKIVYYQRENKKSAPTASLNILTRVSVMDKKGMWILKIIEDAVLGSSQSPLSRALEESELGGDISSISGLITSFLFAVFSIGIDDFKLKKGESIDEALIRAKEEFLKILYSVVQNGIDEEFITSSIKYYEFLIKEDGSRKPHALIWTKRLISSIVRNSSDYISPLCVSETINEIKEEYKKNKNLFTDFIKENILDAKNSLIMVCPDENVKQKAMDNIKSNALLTYNNYDIKNDTKHAFLNKADKNKSVICPRSSFSDLKQYFQKESYEEDMVSSSRYIYKYRDTRGISYINVIFDISDLSIEEMKILSLLNTAAFHVDVGDTSASEFTKKLLKHCVKLSFSIKTVTEQNNSLKIKSYLIISAKMLDEDVDQYLSLLSSLLQCGKFDNAKSIKNTMTDFYGSLYSSLTYSPEAMFMPMAYSVFSYKNQIQKELLSFPIIRFANEIINSGEFEKTGKQLLGVINRITTASRLTVHILSDKKIDISSFVHSFEQGCYRGVYSRLPNLEMRDIMYSYPFATSYNALSFSVESENNAYAVFCEFLNSASLWKRLRLDGGAYGCGSSYLSEGQFVMHSFCDPNISKTYDSMLLSLKDEIDDDLDKYKLIALSDLASVKKSEEDSALSLIRYLSKTTDEYRLSYIDRIINATKKDVLNARDSLISGECKKITLSSKERIIEELNNPNGIISVL